MSSFLTRKHDFAKIEFSFSAADVRELEFYGGPIVNRPPGPAPGNRKNRKIAPSTMNSPSVFIFRFAFFIFEKSQNEKSHQVLLKSLPISSGTPPLSRPRDPPNPQNRFGLSICLPFSFFEGRPGATEKVKMTCEFMLQIDFDDS